MTNDVDSTAVEMVHVSGLATISCRLPPSGRAVARVQPRPHDRDSRRRWAPSEPRSHVYNTCGGDGHGSPGRTRENDHHLDSRTRPRAASGAGTGSALGTGVGRAVPFEVLSSRPRASIERPGLPSARRPTEGLVGGREVECIVQPDMVLPLQYLYQDSIGSHGSPRGDDSVECHVEHEVEEIGAFIGSQVARGGVLDHLTGLAVRRYR